MVMFCAIGKIAAKTASWTLTVGYFAAARHPPRISEPAARALAGAASAGALGR